LLWVNLTNINYELWQIMNLYVDSSNVMKMPHWNEILTVEDTIHMWGQKIHW
jgi:hypothetical protein